MIFHHHDLEIEVPGEWWVEAGLDGFTPPRSAYRVANVGAPTAEALKLQHPLPDEWLEIVARGEKEDRSTAT